MAVWIDERFLNLSFFSFSVFFGVSDRVLSSSSSSSSSANIEFLFRGLMFGFDFVGFFVGFNVSFLFPFPTLLTLILPDLWFFFNDGNFSSPFFPSSSSSESASSNIVFFRFCPCGCPDDGTCSLFGFVPGCCCFLFERLSPNERVGFCCGGGILGFFFCLWVVCCGHESAEDG